MKIGITQIILGDTSLADTLELCQEAGYEAVELVFGEEKDLNIQLSRDEVLAVGQRCAEAGVEIGSVIAWYAERGNLLSRSSVERDQGCKSLLRSLEIAGILGVDGVLLHPGQLGAEGTYEEAWDDLRDLLKEAAQAAAANNAVIGLENVWNKFLLSPKEMREIIDEIDSEWVGAYLDTANMMAYGYPEQWIRELGARIKRVHFKDFNRREHRFVNLLDGDTDWSTVVAELRQAGYDRPVIHEVGGDRDAQIDLAQRMRQIVAIM